MDKRQLARELRRRQYNYGLLEKRLIDAISDDQIIDCYITCPCCGEKAVNAQQLVTALEHAQSAEQFFQFCDGFAGARPHMNQGSATRRFARKRKHR